MHGLSKMTMLTLFFLKKEKGEREEDETRKRDAAAHTPLTAVPWKERWRDGRRN